jgi:hypothetical protein
VKRVFNLFDRVAFRGGHSRGVIFAPAGRNTAFGLGLEHTASASTFLIIPLRCRYHQNTR